MISSALLSVIGRRIVCYYIFMDARAGVLIPLRSTLHAGSSPLVSVGCSLYMNLNSGCIIQGKASINTWFFFFFTSLSHTRQRFFLHFMHAISFRGIGKGNQETVFSQPNLLWSFLSFPSFFLHPSLWSDIWTFVWIYSHVLIIYVKIKKSCDSLMLYV